MTDRPTSPSNSADDARTRLRIGFIPLVDCAPLVVARDLGFAAEEGLELDLVRETSWANIRDRIVFGHFDAAHMLAPMAIATRLGLGHIQAPLLAPWVLNRGGNSIAVTPALWDEGGDWGAFGDPLSSGRALAAIVADRARRGDRQLTFASVYPFSCHDYQLRHWMSAAGIDPDRDLRLVVVPPPHMVAAMESGSVDGICVGAPWTSRAVDAGVGRLLLPSAALWPSSPEKVLGLREDFASRRPEILAALLRALDRAAAWSDAPENRTALAALLAGPGVIGVPQEIVMRSLTGELLVERHRPGVTIDDFLKFHGDGEDGPLNRPRVADGMWFAAQMVRWGQVADADAAFAAARDVFSPALWDAAIGSPAEETRMVRTFEAPPFTEEHPEAWLAAHGAR